MSFFFFGFSKDNKTSNVRIKVTLKSICLTIDAVRKQINTYSECVSVGLVIQHIMRVRRVIMCVQYFFHN